MFPYPNSSQVSGATNVMNMAKAEGMTLRRQNLALMYLLMLSIHHGASMCVSK